MKILLLNQDWFKEELCAAGHEVVSVGADDHFQVRLRASFLRWEEVVSLCPWEPEAVIVYDNSVPIFVSGLESLPIPILFYSVDVHHHLKWQRSFPRVFDRVYVAQKDYIASFDQGFAPVDWLPLWASHISTPQSEKTHEAVFVGTLNPELNPDRVVFFKELEKKTSLACVMGEYWHIYPRSKVIINQTVRGDLNFRVFEAIVSGIPLVTERIANGLFDIFTDGVHLVSYERGDADDAAQKISKLLNDPSRREQIGGAGREEVLSKHLSKHRAQSLFEGLNGIQQPATSRSRFGLSGNFTALGRFLEEQKRNPIPAHTEALRLVEEGIRRNEAMSYEIGENIMEGLSHYDRLRADSRADRILAKLTDVYPTWFRK